MMLPLDTGIAAQTILLGAVEVGLGGCMIGSIDRAALKSALHIPESFEILLVIALGKPKEEIVIDESIQALILSTGEMSSRCIMFPNAN